MASDEAPAASGAAATMTRTEAAAPTSPTTAAEPTSPAEKTTKTTEQQQDEQPSQQDEESKPAAKEPEKVFVAAPVPTVNVWHMRKEQRAAPKQRVNVGDSKMWPTPETAKDQERQKAKQRQERVEREKEEKEKVGSVPNSTSKAHGKEKWTALPYTPTPVFETQISRRGGRSSWGTREAFGRGGAGAAGTTRPPVNGERIANGGPTDTETLSKDGVSARAGHGQQPLYKGPRRGRGASQLSKDGTRRPPVNGVEDSSIKTNEQPPLDPRPGDRTTSSTQTDFPTRQRQDSKTQSQSQSQSQSRRQSLASVSGGGPRNDRYRPVNGETHPLPRPPYAERRSDGSGSRDRGSNGSDGRPERGRGGHRGGRGGMNGHIPHHQLPPHPGEERRARADGSMPPLSKMNSYSSQEQSFQPYGQQPNNHYGGGHNHRNVHRAHSIQTGPFSNYNGFQNGPASAIPSLRTNFSPGYDFQSVPPMTAIPYAPPYVEQFSPLNTVSYQLNYYFSVENLCKDMFLRKHMDSQGFVPLTVLSRFNRIKQVTPEIEVVRTAAMNTPTIEIRFLSEGKDRVRKRFGWEQWVLNMEEREPSAQNDGPPEIQPSWMPPNGGEPAFSPYGFQAMSPNSFPPQDVQSPAFFQPNGFEPLFSPGHMPLNNDMTNGGMNGNVNGDYAGHSSAAHESNQTSVSQTPLSAAVPDFAPSTAFQKMDLNATSEQTGPLKSPTKSNDKPAVNGSMAEDAA